MKTLLTVLTLLSFNAFADHHEKPKTFEEKKEKTLKMLDKRLSAINESKTCVTNAKDEAALKVCKEKMKADRKAMHDKWNKKKKKA